MTVEPLDLDVLLADLAPIEVPADLSAQTWASITQEMDAKAPSEAGTQRKPLRWVGFAMAMAAVSLVWIRMPSNPTPADPERLVEKGIGNSVPHVSLKVAVRQGNETKRLHTRASHAPGDVLYFRGGLDRAAHVTLVRVTASGSDLLYSGNRPAGEADLPHEGGALAWQIEAGESDAIYALLAASEPQDTQGLEAILTAAYDFKAPNALCQAVAPYGLQCAASAVQVTPMTEGGTLK